MTIRLLSKKMRRSIFGALMFLSFALVGCAPQFFSDGVPWTVQQYRTTDAKTQTVRPRPFLRVDSRLIAALREAVAVDDATLARDSFRKVVEDCRHLAKRSVRNEIARLPPIALQQLWDRYFPGQDRPRDLKHEIAGRYASLVEAQYRDFLKDLDGRKSLDGLRLFANAILANVNPSPKDQHGQGLLLKMAMDANPEPLGPLDKGGPNVDLYLPDEASLSSFTSGGGDAKSEGALLARWAPLIVQERTADTSYKPKADVIGTVRLQGTHDSIEVVVDTASPSVYGYWQQMEIGKKRYLQLIYVYWFPEHPALRPGDPEAGRVDGATLRITLDSDDLPALFETILNCGCYHRCYPATELEAKTRKQYGGPLAGKSYCAERALEGKPDWIVPECVEVPKNAAGRPILFGRAGYHAIAGISFDRRQLEKRQVAERRGYRLRPYDELEELPTPYGLGSMFGADGLVHFAGRPEGWLLAGTGMLSAGQPRQRGTQLIRWDQYDFDDPHLLEKCLRLPKDF